MKTKVIPPLLLLIALAYSGGIVFTQDKNAPAQAGSGESTTTVSSPDAEVWSRGMNIVGHAIPAPVKDIANTTHAALEQFRTREYFLVEAARFDNIDRINALNEKEIGVVASKTPKSKEGTASSTSSFGWQDHTERLLRYLYWAGLTAAGTILARAWLFYIVLALAALTSLRVSWRRIRGTSDF